MTREEAIKELQESVDTLREYNIAHSSRLKQALEMAIKALSQSFECDDAISRDFEIGDEVRIIGSNPIYDDCDVGWVIRNASEKVKTMYVMRNDGSAEEETKAEWYKTGRHNVMLAEVIKALPSVTQKSDKYRKEAKRWKNKWLKSQKSGKWIDINGIYAECSNCNEEIYITGDFKYCPNCGAKMIEPQERSDKE